jgi:hypothetical protein
MLSQSDVDIPSALSRLNGHELDVTLLVPTRTAIEKSIMDATAPVRAYLASVGCHDFDEQPQGPEHKRLLRAYLVHPSHLEEVKASVYRPITKSGDPRIWFYKLASYAEPRNLLAVFFHEEALYVVNCSNPEVMDTLDNPSSPLGQLVAYLKSQENPAALELLDKLREVGSQGYIRTLRPGPTGVGMTLETLLGIAANSSQAPDYKGIEIKASRSKVAGRQNRNTLFSQVPAWKLSPVGSAWNLLSRFGYEREGRLQLYHQLDAIKPNSIGLMLEVDSPSSWLKQNFVDGATKEHILTWEMEKLRSRLIAKHPATFWVKAETRGTQEEEEFFYTEVVYTRLPRAWNLEFLIETGTITLDFTLSDKGGRVRDHGYLFKIHPNNLEALFPPPRIYPLI